MNFIMDLIRSVLRRGAANFFFTDIGLGTVSAPANLFDDTSFFDTLAQLFGAAGSDAEFMIRRRCRSPFQIPQSPSPSTAP